MVTNTHWTHTHTIFKSNPNDIEWTTCYPFMTIMTIYTVHTFTKQKWHTNYNLFELFAQIKEIVTSTFMIPNISTVSLKYLPIFKGVSLSMLSRFEHLIQNNFTLWSWKKWKFNWNCQINDLKFVFYFLNGAANLKRVLNTFSSI